MRIMRYYVINKTTKKAVYTHHSEKQCKDYLANMADRDNYAVGHKWLSI